MWATRYLPSGQESWPSTDLADVEVLLAKPITRLGGGGSPLKGVALKTHEGLRPSTLRAFKKA